MSVRPGSININGWDKLIFVSGKFKTRKKVVSSPICLADGTIIVGSYDKHLYFFSPQGVLLGKYKTKGKIFATPIVLDNNTIVVCSTNGYIEFLKVKPMFALSE